MGFLRDDLSKQRIIVRSAAAIPTRSDMSLQHTQLLPNADKYKSVKAQLSRMYSQIFDGPTPGFPEEDEVEHRHKAAFNAHAKLFAAHHAELSAAQKLNEARRAVSEINRHLKQALTSCGSCKPPSFFHIARFELIVTDTYNRVCVDVGILGAEGQSMHIASMDHAIRASRDLALHADSCMRDAITHSNSVAPIKLLQVSNALVDRPENEPLNDEDDDGDYLDVNVLRGEAVDEWTANRFHGMSGVLNPPWRFH